MLTSFRNQENPSAGKWLAVFLVVSAIAFSAMDIGYHYDRLPPQMASHFDARGRPDDWSTKQQFVGMAIATLAVVTVALTPLTLLAYFAPKSLINLPNKEYWLAPERETETRRAIAQWGIWFTAATLWLLALVFHEAMAANLRQPPQMKSIWCMLGGYLLLVLVMVIQLIARFWRKA
jgi:uncharacterized membrane protein